MDIDALRKLDGTLHSPAQDVVGLSVGASELYHFYSDNTANIDDIHNHRRSFTSKVVKGVLRNNLYDIIDNPDSNFSVLTGQCLQFCKASQNLCFDNLKVVRENIEPMLSASFETAAGNMYFLNYNTFHNLERKTPTVITHILWRDIQQASPQFIRDMNNGIKCEYNTSISDNKMWEIIEHTLEYDNEQPE